MLFEYLHSPKCTQSGNVVHQLSLHSMKLLSLVTQMDLGFHGTAGNKITGHLKHVSSKPYLPSVHRFETARRLKPTLPLPVNHGLKPELKHKLIPAQKQRKPKPIKHSTKYRNKTTAILFVILMDQS